MSRRSATPIQKSEKMSAVTRERIRRPSVKERNSVSGRIERRSWRVRKDCPDY